MSNQRPIISKRNTAAAAVVVWAGLLSASAGAVDGEILVNQGKVNAGGITPGDDPGFPATLSRAGRYKLAGNLAASAGKIGIHVTDHDVTIDFAGFRLHGGGVANNGIVSSRHSLTIKNGTIALFKLNGIYGSGAFWTIDNMRIVVNGRIGIDAYGEARRWTIANSQLVENGSTGIAVGSAHPMLIRNNVVSGNGGVGISVLHAHIEGNLVADNGYSGAGAYYGGISVTTGTVLGNTITDNQGIGLIALDAVGSGNNVLSGNNAGGPQLSGPTPLHPNVCNGVAC